MTNNLDVTVKYHLVSKRNDGIIGWAGVLEVRQDADNLARIYNEGETTTYTREIVSGGVSTTTTLENIAPSGYFRISRWYDYWRT